MRLFLLIMLLAPTTALAKEYRFKWNMKNETLSYKTNASSWEEAFQKASQFCFDYSLNKQTKISEDIGLSIIDICVNPK